MSTKKTEIPPKPTQSATELTQLKKPAKEVFDIFSVPTKTRSLGSIPDDEVFVKMSTFIVPQHGDGITWDQSVILAPREIDEIAIVLSDTESESSVTSVSHLASGDTCLAPDSSSTEIKTQLLTKPLDKDKNTLRKIATAVDVFMTLVDEYIIL
jgi:hypothetical protein